MKIFRGVTEENIEVYFTEGPNGEQVLLNGSLSDGWINTGTHVAIQKILPPVKPYIIFGVGLNYRSYAESTGLKIPDYPLIFVKQGSSAIGHEEKIQLPRFLEAEKVDYEGELALVIGKECKNCTAEDALDFVAGYTCANDVSSRDWQFEKGGGQFSRGKTFDTFCPLGPCMVTADEIPDAGKLELKTWVNGELRQQVNTGDMIFSIPEIIAFLSGSTTLLPGTVILTGTPGGTGSSLDPKMFLQEGDRVRISVEGIGFLENSVEEERA